MNQTLLGIKDRLKEYLLPLEKKALVDSAKEIERLNQIIDSIHKPSEEPLK